MSDDPTVPNPRFFTASAPVPIGRHAEPEVLRVVGELLHQAGHKVSPLPAEDQRGEDARLSIDGQPYTVQVTGVPHAPDFWRRVVSEGSATTSATQKQLTGWLNDAIQAKLGTVQPSERAQTILALDAHDWSFDVLHPNTVARLSTGTLNPAQQAGIAGIAITGRASSNSTWVPGFIL